MIKSIKELQNYVINDLDEKDDVIFQRPCMMTSPGRPKEEIEELKKALPSIPDSYTKWVEAVNLNGIAVGFFDVCPASFCSGGMVANIIEGNRKDVLFWEQMQQYHLYSVATIDGYGIFVATSSSPYKEGEIIAIDEEIYGEENNPEQWIYKLSKDFEQFLIVAGNVNQIRREVNKDDSNYDEKKKEFLDRLKQLDVAEEYYEAWMLMFY
jgi:hypothetical protein